MTVDYATVINNYHEKCANLLQTAPSNSAENYAASQMIQAFDQSPTSPANERVMRIAKSLALYARSLKAIPTAPPEKHAMGREARTIARKWALDFMRDTEQEPRIYGL